MIAGFCENMISIFYLPHSIYHWRRCLVLLFFGTLFWRGKIPTWLGQRLTYVHAYIPCAQWWTVWWYTQSQSDNEVFLCTHCKDSHCGMDDHKPCTWHTHTHSCITQYMCIYIHITCIMYIYIYYILYYILYVYVHVCICASTCACDICLIICHPFLRFQLSSHRPGQQA